MQPQTTMSKGKIWTGRIMCLLAILFLLFDSIGHIFRPKYVVEATKAAGLDTSILLPIGIAMFVFLIIFMIPRTAVWGALLITGYLGGAAASNVLTNTEPLLIGIGMPVVTCVFLWAGLYVASPKLRAILTSDFRQ